MIESAKSAYSQYFSISGRASRYEFWSFMLYQFVGLILIGCICVLASYVFDDKRGLSFTLMALWYLFHLIPNFTILVRRLHDTSRSGWWLLLVCLHGLGVLILFIFTLSRSSEDNEYGPKRDLKYWYLNKAFCLLRLRWWRHSLLWRINKKRGLYFRKILFKYVCDSGRIQTCNLLIRSQMLYSVELRSHAS